MVVKGEDELARLAESFNKMAAELKTLYGDFERKVDQRTLQLQRQTQLAELRQVVAG
ncbi:hypothetical protein IV102_35955 [bacterium]|nr:hypothetical protein [bacterium]